MLVLSSLVYAQDWRSSTPSRSTCKGVEQIIGSPIKPGGVECDLPNERVLK